MPKVSRESAAHVDNHGPVEDRHEDIDDYTVNELHIVSDTMTRNAQALGMG